MKTLWRLMEALSDWSASLGERGEIGEQENADKEEDGMIESSAEEGDKEAESAEQDGGKAQAEEEKSDKGSAPSYGGFKSWEHRARHFEDEYKKERTKRQAFQKGLPSSSSSKDANQDRRGTEKKLNDFETLAEYDAYLEEKFGKNIDEKVDRKTREIELSHRMENSQERAREKHDGSDDLPAYDELIDEYVLPLIEGNPAIYRLLRESFPDPAEAAYTLGFLKKHSSMESLANAFKGQGRKELVDNIDKATKKAVLLKGQRETGKQSSKLTAAEIMAMKDEDVERENAKITGRIY